MGGPSRPRIRDATSRGAPAAPGRLRARGTWGALRGPPLGYLNRLRHSQEAPQQRQPLTLEPRPRRLVAVAERGAARLEAHRRPEERRLLAAGLDQVKLGARMLDPQRRQAELQEVLAVD